MTELRQIIPDVKRLLLAMGSVWSDQFRDTAVLQDLLEAQLINADHGSRMATAARRGLSRHALSDSRWREWQRLELRSTDVSYGIPLRYGDAATYGDGSSYGDSSRDGMSVPLPAGVTAIDVITDAITAGTKVFTAGTDYVVADGRLWLLFNPFTTPGFTTRVGIDSSGNSYQVVSLWLYGVSSRSPAPFDRYGCVLNLPAAAAMRVINACYNARWDGPSVAAITDWLQACTAQPLYSSAVVTDVVTDSRKHVITPDAVYSHSSDTNILVSRGDVIARGFDVSDAVTITDVPVLDDGVACQTVFETRNVELSPPDYEPQRSAAIRTFGRRRPNDPVVRGYFGEESLTVRRADVEPGSYDVSFDLLVVGTGWRGNVGPSRLTVSSDADVVLQHSFSNTAAKQSYPVAAQLPLPRSLHSYTSYNLRCRAVTDSSVLQLKFEADGLGATTAYYAVYFCGDTAAQHDRYKGVFETKAAALTLIASESWPQDDRQRLAAAVAESDDEVVEQYWQWETSRDDSMYHVYPATAWAISNLKLTAVLPRRRALPRGNTSTALQHLPGLVLGSHALQQGYSGGLFFPNRDVELQYDGTTVRFEIGGRSADVERFWRGCDDYLEARGYSLAQVFDNRVAISGEPQLPQTINPMHFLCRHFLAHSAAVITRRSSSAATPLGYRNLRRLLPAHMTYLAQVELAINTTTTAQLTENIVIAAGVVVDSLNGMEDMAPQVAYTEGAIQQ